MNRRVWIRPRFCRYRVADDVAARFRPGWNAYDNADGTRCRIGAVVVVGRYAYCVLWAKAVMQSIHEYLASEIDKAMGAATPRPEEQR